MPKKREVIECVGACAESALSGNICSLGICKRKRIVYVDKPKEELKVGDMVRLKKRAIPMTGGDPSYNNEKAAITSFLSDVEGGIFLKDGLRGCRYWNIADVERVPMSAFKVFGGLTFIGRKQVRTIVAATSRAKALVALKNAGLHVTANELATHWVPTGNKRQLEIALAQPGQVFCASPDDAADFQKLTK